MRWYLGKKGFTLGELLVVVAIIAILITVSVTVFASKREETEKTVCSYNISTIKRIYATRVLELGCEGITSKEANEILKYAVEQAGDGEYKKSNGYEAKCGGYCFVTYGENPLYSSIDKIFCKEHNVDKGNWLKGETYNRGDIMTSNGFVFACLQTHKSGSRSNTRDPSVKSNKGSWEVIGTTDGEIPTYNATVRFAVGYQVVYKNNIYERTNYNLTGGQTPYSKSSSRYWILVGPAT